MKIKRAVSGLALGTLFGLGLAVSQMANPEKVLAFLNIAADWDPSLLLVMAAATGVALIGFRWATRRPPLFEARHYLPTSTDIDTRLVGGAMLFGLGWGLAGYCPGPAITGLGSGSPEPWIFVASMLAGSQLSRLIAARAPESRNSTV